MSTITEVLEMIIKADVNQAKSNIEDLEKSVDSLKDSADNLSDTTKNTTTRFDDFSDSSISVASKSDILTDTLIAQAAGWLSMAAAVNKAIQIFAEADAAASEERIGLARLKNVLDATGRSASTSASRIDELASALEDTLKIDKQAIMDVSAELATMGNISTDLFADLFQAGADVAATFGTDIGSAIKSLAIAMEDPNEGLSKLRRQGIFISEEMISQITYLAEQNQKYEAQKLLLDEIENKVGGAAKAIADASASASLATSWGKFIGEFGKTFEGVSGMFKNGAASVLDFFTKIMEDGNSLSDFLAVDIEDLSKMSIAELEDYLEEAKKWLENSRTDYAKSQWSVMVTAAQDYLDTAIQIKEEEDKRLEAEKELALQNETYAKELANQKELTTEISALWSSTDEGTLSGLENQIERLTKLKEADEAILKTLTDSEIIKQVESRLQMYDDIISSTQERIDALNKPKSTDTTKRSPDDILGMSADKYVLNIPLSFDFGRTDKEELEAQIAKLKSSIESLWSSKPEEMTEEWSSSLNILLAKYNELQEKSIAINESQELEIKANKELEKLLSDKEKATRSLSEYEAEIKKLLDNKLISQEQYNLLLEEEKKNLGLITTELTKQEKAQKTLGDSWNSFIDSSLSVEAIASRLSSAFYDMGEALATDGDLAKAASNSVADFTDSLARSFTDLAISAGLRCIVEGNIALGLALLALGGLTGIGVGAMSASSKAISDEMQRQLNDELEARKKLTESLNTAINEEYQLLKRQLERNLISEDDFVYQASLLQHQKDVSNARTELSSATLNKINNLNSEYSSMSGWDKFWSGRDEDIIDAIDDLKKYYAQIDTATEDELRELIAVLASLGVSTGGVSKFASGGTFTTTGPRLIAVGDNPSGIEHVTITPSESAKNNGTTIIITGDVYGWEDMVGKLKLANTKIQRRKA